MEQSLKTTLGLLCLGALLFTAIYGNYQDLPVTPHIVPSINSQEAAGLISPEVLDLFPAIEVTSVFLKTVGSKYYVIAKSATKMMWIEVQDPEEGSELITYITKEAGL